MLLVGRDDAPVVKGKAMANIGKVLRAFLFLRLCSMISRIGADAPAVPGSKQDNNDPEIIGFRLLYLF